MTNQLKLKIKVGEAVDGVVKAVQNLKDVAVKVAAEADASDEETTQFVQLFQKLAEGMLPLEVINAKIKKDIEES